MPCLLRETDSNFILSFFPRFIKDIFDGLSYEIKSPKTQTANFHNDQTFNLTYVMMCLEILEIKSDNGGRNNGIYKRSKADYGQ